MPFCASAEACVRHFETCPSFGQGPWLQRLDEPHHLFSFEPWPTLEDTQGIRGHPDMPKEISKLVDLCDEGRP